LRLMLPMMRRAVGLGLLLLMSACGEEPLSSPTAPTVTPVARGGPPSLSTRTVTGSVWLYLSSEPQPLSGIDVGVWLERPRSTGPAGSARSDSAGRFSFEAPSDALVRLYARTKELFQPCLSTVRVGQTEAAVRVVAQSHFLEARDWPDFTVRRLLSGTVFESSSAGRLPSADAWVQVDGVMGDGRPLADTRTDANGRFVVCGLEGETQIPHALVVAKSGYQIAYARIPPQGGGQIDVELRACAADRPRLEGGWCY
jgi:hypothetical protein